MHDIQFAPAGTLPLDRLAELFTRSFEGYFYAMNVLPEQLAQRVRLEQIDLWRSPLLMVAGEPAGVALVALRGERAWCGGFGITMPWRSKGMALPLAQQMLEEARQGGAQHFALEVLARNERATQVYLRAGLRAVRDLLILEWRRSPGADPNGGPDLAHAKPEQLLASFARLHPTPAAWQRDLPTLLSRSGLRGLALREGEQLSAYALYQDAPGGGARLIDLAAVDQAAALRLLASLKQRFERVTTVNEPDDSPTTHALIAAGFIELDRQHEMSTNLA
jgi:Acetyltransferase (GNAT) family